MPHGDVETFHKDGAWHNRIEGGDVLPGAHRTKEEAVQAGRERAKQDRVEHIIRDLDGRIGQRSTYGHDPRSIPG